MTFLWKYFLLGFCRYPLLPLTLLLLLGLAAGRVGSGYAMQELIFDDTSSLRGLSGGFAIGLLVVQVAVVGMLLTARDRMPELESAKTEPKNPRPPRLLASMRSVLGYAAAVVMCLGMPLFLLWLFGVGGKLFNADFREGYFIEFGAAWPPAIGLIGGLLAGSVGIWVCRYAVVIFDNLEGDWFNRNVAVLFRTIDGKEPVTPFTRVLFVFSILIGLAITYLAAAGVATPGLAGRWDIGLAAGVLVALAAWAGLRRLFPAAASALVAEILRRRSEAGGVGPGKLPRWYSYHGGLALYVPAVFVANWATGGVFDTPVVIVALFLFAIISLYGLVAYVGGQGTVVVITGAVFCLALFAGEVEKYRFRLPNLDYPERAEDRVSVADVTNNQNLIETVGDGKLKFAACEQADRQKRPLVIVATAGGGLRSAVWTLAVLDKLTHACAKGGVDFASHLRVITGASGGMVGATHYVVTLPSLADRRAYLSEVADEAPARYQDLANTDFLTPVLRKMAFDDLPSLLSPFQDRDDRGQTLEREFDQFFSSTEECGKGFRTTFADLSDGERSGRYPSLIFSPMMIEDGRRLLISNLGLRGVASNDGAVLCGADGRGTFSKESVELFRVLPDAKASFTVGTAARMSATFPFLSPPATLPFTPRRRIIDAGAYDNHGVSLAASWLFSERNSAWIEENASKVILIQIRGSAEAESRTRADLPEDTDSALSRVFEEFSSPLEALLKMRSASSSFRNDGLLELLSKYLNRPDRKDHFTTLTFELEYDTSVNWWLSAADRDKITESIGNTATRAKIDRFVEWIK